MGDPCRGVAADRLVVGDAKPAVNNPTAAAAGAAVLMAHLCPSTSSRLALGLSVASPTLGALTPFLCRRAETHSANKSNSAKERDATTQGGNAAVLLLFRAGSQLLLLLLQLLLLPRHFWSGNMSRLARQNDSISSELGKLGRIVASAVSGADSVACSSDFSMGLPALPQRTG